MRILATGAIAALCFACGDETTDVAAHPGVPAEQPDLPRNWEQPSVYTTLRGATERPIAWFEHDTGEVRHKSARRAVIERFGVERGWTVDIDPVLETVRAMSGEGIAFDAGDLEAAAMAFVREHAELFGTTEFVYAGAVVDPTVIQIQLAQRHHGVPVIGGHLGLTIAHGRLVLVQGTTYPVGATPGALASLATVPHTPLVDAIATVRAQLPASPGDRDDGRLVVMPEREPGKVGYRLAWEIDAWRDIRHGIAYVDAHTGGIAAVYDAHVYEYAGVATNEVDERTVGDRVITVPASFLRLSSARGQAMTGAAGEFRFAGMPKLGTRAEVSPLTVTAGLRGRFVDVSNVSGPDATFVGMLMPEKQYQLVWDEARSLPEERDAFHMVNRTNRFVATVFPELPWMDQPLLAKVNHQYTCNAFWNGSSINFFVEGGGCNNTARIFDVVAHEWGHGLDQNAPGGALDGALGEFIGDLISFVQTKSPLLGLGFFKDGAPVRDLEDPEFRCYDTRKREVHDAGHMLGEVVWDIHQDLERIGFTGEPLKRLMLLPIAGAQSRAQWYRQMLAVDDNDGNLANGTPHECLIYNQFKAHSCNGTRWPGLPEKDPPGCSAN